MSRGSPRLRVYALLLLLVIACGIAWAILSSTSFFGASAPRQTAGTIEVTLATQPTTSWAGDALCTRSTHDGLMTSVLAPDIGSLQGARVWIVVLLDYPDAVVVALGQAAPGARPFHPTTEYGSGVAGDAVERSSDRARGIARFRLPLVKGDPLPLAGAETSASGSLVWTCGATPQGRFWEASPESTP